MRLTLIHPSIGRRPGKRYIRTWQMEPLPVARIAGLTPPDVDIRFYDDRMENIPFDEETDLVALSVETYTARRAYQIATEYRRRNVPVVMGGFHATLCTEEVSRFAETVVIGEAEGSWPQLISDFRHGRLQRMYREKEAPSLAGLVYNRNIYRDKRYLPLGLIETGRGCPFTCEFCAIQSFFHQSHRRRPVEDVVREIEGLPQRAFFFVDDNFASDLTHAKHLLRALIPLKIRWITQMTINAARDREFLSLLGESGCQGVLIGFETLDEGTLKAMDKGVNLGGGGYDKALENLRHHGIRVYGTFIFGYDNDTPASFDRALEFAGRHRFYMAAFNHLTPFPGTPLYRRLKDEGRLTNPAWWLDSSYRYNSIPFQPMRISPESLQENCIRARKEFFGLRSMLKRGFDPVNRSNMFMLMQFFMINGLHRLEISRRNHHPLGQEPWNGPLLEVSPEPRALRA